MIYLYTICLDFIYLYLAEQYRLFSNPHHVSCLYLPVFSMPIK